MRNRRLPAAAAASVTALLVLSGCAQSGGDAGGSVTITYWTHVNAPTQAVEEQLIAQYEEQNPHVTVEYLPVEFGTLPTKLNSAIAGEAGPDLVNYFQSYAAGLQAKGYLAPVDFDAIGVEESEFVSRYPEPVAAGFSADDELIGIPHEISTYQFWINNDYFTDAGLDPTADFPLTWDDVVAVGETVQSSDTGPQEALSLSLNSPVRDSLILDAMTRQAGGSLFSEDGRTSYVNSKEAVRALQTWGDFANVHGINDPSLGPTASTNAEDLFGDGTAAMVNTGGSWFVPTLGQTYPDVSYTVGQYPTFGKNEVGANLYGYGLYVPSTSDNQGEAWKFAAFLADNSETYFTEAGVWLGDEAILESDVTSSVPDWDVFAEGFQRGNFLPPLVNYNEVSQALEDAIQRVVVNGLSAQESLDTAHAEIEPLLQQ